MVLLAFILDDMKAPGRGRLVVAGLTGGKEL
jgi:hypothetical protein